MCSETIKNGFLALVQDGFPLAGRPFKVIGGLLGIDEDEALGVYRTLKEEKIIRQTSAILDTKKLGYDSSLVAFAVCEDGIGEIAAFISSHPGVSHNYKRAHDFNLWFTLAIPPDSKIGLSATVEMMAKKVGAKDFMILPTVKMFKIAVKLDTNKTKELKEKVVKKETESIDLTAHHYAVIAKIQDDLEVTKEPFAKIISELGIGYPELFALLDDLANGGYMRRYASILNHRKAGFVANAMVVWDIADEYALDAGAKAAEFSAVSHCYLRPRFKKWPYNLFTMIHASSTDEIERIISKMESELGARGHFVLTTLEEYKKIRIKYFTQDIYEWEKNMLKEHRLCAPIV